MGYNQPVEKIFTKYCGVALQRAEQARKMDHPYRFTKIRCKEYLSAILLSILSGLSLWSCGQQQNPRNLVLITIDTLRADHLTPYGSKRNTSPFLEKLARESFLFEDAVSQCGTTPQSLSSIMTGLYPYTDDIITGNGPFNFLKRSSITLAQILKENGYITHGITSHIQAAPVTGINLGFGTFDAVDVSPKNKNYSARSAEEITDLALQWLKDNANKEKPFFLWLHYVDPHYPYAPPKEYKGYFADEEPSAEGETRFYRFDERESSAFPLTAGKLQRMTLNYDREILYTDRSLEFLFKKELNGLLKDTLVIFSADHGEALGNHDMITHNDVYQAILHVPLFIRFPGKRPPRARIGAPVMLVDLFPTIFEMLNIPSDLPIRGESLVPLMSGGTKKKGVERRVRLAEYPDRQALISDDGIKLIIRGESRQLYDLKRDPYESSDLSRNMQDVQDMLVEKYAGLKKESRVFERPEKEVLPKVTPEMIEQLKSLGYVTK